MATGDAYTRLVNITKIVLPLIALAVLSTLFLLSRDIDPESAIPFAEVDVEEIARQQKLTRPHFATVGRDGAAIELTAAEALPNPTNEAQVEARGVRGTIDLPNGGRIELSSGAALVDLDAQTAGFTQQVLMTSTGGYEVAAPEITAALDRAEVSAPGPVQAMTPFGTLDAGAMLLTRTGDNHRLVFNNKVRLVYLPEG